MHLPEGALLIPPRQANGITTWSKNQSFGVYPNTCLMFSVHFSSLWWKLFTSPTPLKLCTNQRVESWELAISWSLPSHQYRQPVWGAVSTSSSTIWWSFPSRTVLRISQQIQAYKMCQQIQENFHILEIVLMWNPKVSRIWAKLTITLECKEHPPTFNLSIIVEKSGFSKYPKMIRVEVGNSNHLWVGIHLEVENPVQKKSGSSPFLDVWNDPQFSFSSNSR